MDGDAAARGRQRIHAFVQSMRPETRQRIVDCCLSSDSVGRPANGLGVATPGGTGVSPEMAELFGADEVLSSLDRLERAGVALAPETMKLFQKLSHLQPDPYDRDPGELPQDPELRDSVGELMGIRAKGEFTPSDYVEQIDACVSGPKTPGAAQWTLDDRQVLLQKAEIALELLREEKDSEGSGSDAIFRFLTDNLDFVIGAGRVDLLSRGVRAAQRRAYKSVSTDGEDGARELLAAIDDAERVTAILEAGGDAGSDCAELIALFREVDYLLARIPQILVESSSARANRAGAEVLLGMSEAHLRPLVEALARMDLAALRALLEVLIALPSSRLAALVEPLREDEDPRVRRLAYRALDAGGAAWGREVMRRALADDDLGVQRIALDHLRAKPDRGAIDTLTDYLRGDLAPGGVMWRSTYRHAAHLLADIEPDGESRVCEILFEGRSRLGRRNAARMREIASVLGDRDESDQAIRAMRRWSLSISRAVGAIAGARLPEGGEK